MSVEFFGDWDTVKNGLVPAIEGLLVNIESNMDTLSKGTQREIRQNIEFGMDSEGNSFEDNTPLTASTKGHNNPLMNTGHLRDSIDHKKKKSGKDISYGVGIFKGEKPSSPTKEASKQESDSKSLAEVAAMLDQGTVKPFTNEEKMAILSIKEHFEDGKPVSKMSDKEIDRRFKKMGSTLEIPPRPFMSSALRMVRDSWKDIGEGMFKEFSGDLKKKQKK